MLRPLRSQIANALDQRVILGIGGLLIQDLDSLSIKKRKLPLDANPIEASHLIPEVILNEEVEVVRIAEKSPLDRDVLNFRCL